MIAEFVLLEDVTVDDKGLAQARLSSLRFKDGTWISLRGELEGGEVGPVTYEQSVDETHSPVILRTRDLFSDEKSHIHYGDQHTILEKGIFVLWLPPRYRQAVMFDSCKSEGPYSDGERLFYIVRGEHTCSKDIEVKAVFERGDIRSSKFVDGQVATSLNTAKLRRALESSSTQSSRLAPLGNALKSLFPDWF